ncbi:Hypothetical predicted protein [Octopus vulgaris]|uniref:Uncharacterized protein n=1 Tax=Octopus vulgaris TaxID=6645 RepID=A0AA36BGJ0_OCTVU|nr:Hypothetical predicted protein [Octopus vulgaris]
MSRSWHVGCKRILHKVCEINIQKQHCFINENTMHNGFNNLSLTDFRSICMITFSTGRTNYNKCCQMEFYHNRNNYHENSSNTGVSY